MVDPELPWTWRLSTEQAGLGTLGDLTCHLVSMAHDLVGPISELTAIAEPVHVIRSLPRAAGQTAAVENDDLAHALVRFASGARGTLASSRIAHGRKNGLRVEVHGSKGTITLNNERMNELELFVADGPPAERGFRTILSGPLHSPYDQFCPAPGHGLGFNDLKTIEIAEYLSAIVRGGETYLFLRERPHGRARHSRLRAVSTETAVGERRRRRSLIGGMIGTWSRLGYLVPDVLATFMPSPSPHTPPARLLLWRTSMEKPRPSSPRSTA